MHYELDRNAFANLSSDVRSAARTAASSERLMRSCCLSAITHSNIVPSTIGRSAAAMYAMNHSNCEVTSRAAQVEAEPAAEKQTNKYVRLETPRPGCRFAVPQLAHPTVLVV